MSTCRRCGKDLPPEEPVWFYGPLGPLCDPCFTVTVEYKAAQKPKGGWLGRFLKGWLLR